MKRVLALVVLPLAVAGVVSVMPNPAQAAVTCTKVTVVKHGKVAKRVVTKIKCPAKPKPVPKPVAPKPIVVAPVKPVVVPKLANNDPYPIFVPPAPYKPSWDILPCGGPGHPLVKCFYGPTAPASGVSDGDTWFDNSPDGHFYHRINGVWVDPLADLH